jgi:hypothetical protein
MHHIHQPYKQIWAHPLPNGHLVGKPKEGQPHLKSKTKNLMWINILDEGYALHDEDTA